ncbi:MAG: biliverdin-producing heme oxygenase [Bacteroidota bacterium]
MDSTTLAVPLMARLKTETRAAHEAAEFAFNLEAVLQRPAAYARILQRFHALHSQVEPLLSVWDWASLGLDFDARRKLPALNADLAFLGVAPLTDRQPAAPFALATHAEAVGALYVIEGSTLGGRIIAKQVRKALGFTQTQGARYFSGYGAETGAYWKRFSHAVNAFGNREQQNWLPIINGAVMTFAAFQHHIAPA